MVQTGFRAANGNRMIGYRLLPETNPIFLWRTVTNRTRPSRSLREGLVHLDGTLSECVNFAALLGWKHIVLAGVDLYDRRYFWLDGDVPRAGDTTSQAPHRTAGVIDSIREWQRRFESDNIRLYSYNPRSLLVPTLPVWRWN